MRRLWFSVILISVAVAVATRGGERQGKSPVKDALLDRPIGDAGQRPVVTRGPDLDAALFKALRPPALPGLRENYYELRAELRHPDGNPVLLASRLRVEDGTRPDKGTVVLDSLIEPGNIVLAMADGSDLGVWQLGIGQASTYWSVLRADKPWALAAAAYRLDDTLVGMKLGRTRDGRISLVVIEKTSGHHTLYEEVEKTSLRFTAVRQWREKRR